MHECFGCSTTVETQLSLSSKSPGFAPVIETDWKLTAWSPLLVNVIDCEILFCPVAVSGNARPKTLGDNTGPTAACPPDGPSDATAEKTCAGEGHRGRRQHQKCAAIQQFEAVDAIRCARQRHLHVRHLSRGIEKDRTRKHLIGATRAQFGS